MFKLSSGQPRMIFHYISEHIITMKRKRTKDIFYENPKHYIAIYLNLEIANTHRKIYV